MTRLQCIYYNMETARNPCQCACCSVLVHSGGVHGGHYYAFIRPTLSDQWYEFDHLSTINYYKVRWNAFNMCTNIMKKIGQFALGD